MVTHNPDNTQTFRVYCPHAETVAILGDFIAPDSPAASLRRMDEGWWETTLRLPPGDYTFRYIVNGQGTIPDYAAAGLARDGSGCWVSCLHVPECEPAREDAEVQQTTAREATITESQARQLASGRPVTLRLEGEESVTLTVTVSGARASPMRTVPRPDRPVERRRESGRIERSRLA